MSTNVNQIVQFMESWAPLDLAESWDNVGLLVGDYNASVNTVMTALDVTEDNVDFAISNGIDLIIAHHPLIFKPIKSLAGSSTQNRIIRKLCEHRISVYATHTNMDIADGGTNDVLAEMLELSTISGLVEVGAYHMYKIVVFVPKTHVDIVRRTMGDAGCGAIGAYSHCSFTSDGEGQFLPVDGATPTIGRCGELTCVEEVRIESIVQKANIEKVLEAIRFVHPYEEVAYDLYPIQSGGKKHYLGRVGDWSYPIDLVEAVERIRQVLNIPVIRYTEGAKKKIQRIALCTGSGMEFYKAAIQAGADLFLTADVRYHDAQDANNLGLSVVDGHHFYTEIPIASAIAKRLEVGSAEFEWDIKVLTDETARDVFVFNS